MPAVRRLFKHARIETAVRQRKCHRKQNEHEILKGDICLVIRDPDGRDKNYCIECAMRRFSIGLRRISTVLLRVSG